jgi:molybdopterin/thiamine biosynthesis adenylyltransferase
MVVSEGGYAARIVGQGTPVRVFEVGANRRILYDPNMSTEVDDLSQYDRQVRAFGIDAQVRLAQLKVAIVGLGGTGSVVAQELVHLGVRNFLLIDPDHVDHSNLNRLAGSSADDIAKLKVEVAARYIRDVNPNAAVECLAENVMRARVARRLADVDFFFGCTDSHGSRAVLQQISYQYLVPAIDIGSTIVVDRGRVTHVLGRVQMLAPGLACFTCSGLLNPNEVRRDMMTNVERLADPYIVGAREPAPAVMSLNATVASLAVTMLLSAITSIGGNARYLLYNLLGSSLRPVAPVQQPNCFICSRSGALAHGDDALLMARQD